MALCDKDEIINIYPCLQCLSKSELLATLLMVLALQNGKDVSTDLPTMMEESACLACLDDSKFLQAIVGVVGYGVISQDTPINEIQDDVKCLLCVDPQRIKAMIVKELCTFFTALQV